MDKRIALELLALALKYGAPAVAQAIETAGKDNVSIADIEALVCKAPEDYLDKPGR